MQGIFVGQAVRTSNSKLSLDRYLDIVHEIEKNRNYRVPSQEFFKEIDGLVDSVLNPTQLKLVR